MTETIELKRSVGPSYLVGPVSFGEALDQTGQALFFNSSSVNFTGFQAGNATSEVTYTFPVAGPTTTGFFLVSTTAGVLSWSKAVKGTSTNDDAAAGDVGEYFESVVSTATNVPGLNGAWGDGTSIPLTAGDWDVSATFLALANGATFTRFQVGISVTSGNSTTGLVQGNNQLDAPLPLNGVRGGGVSIPSYRLKLTGNTTTYLKVYSDYTLGTPQFLARISARRPR